VLAQILRVGGRGPVLDLVSMWTSHYANAQLTMRYKST
jgi:hypothetical protein